MVVWLPSAHPLLHYPTTPLPSVLPRRHRRRLRQPPHLLPGRGAFLANTSQLLERPADSAPGLPRRFCRCMQGPLVAFRFPNPNRPGGQFLQQPLRRRSPAYQRGPRPMRQKQGRFRRAPWQGQPRPQHLRRASRRNWRRLPLHGIVADPQRQPAAGIAKACLDRHQQRSRARLAGIRPRCINRPGHRRQHPRHSNRARQGLSRPMPQAVQPAPLRRQDHRQPVPLGQVGQSFDHRPDPSARWHVASEKCSARPRSCPGCSPRK